MASCDAALLPFVSNFVWFNVCFSEGYAICMALGYNPNVLGSIALLNC